MTDPKFRNNYIPPPDYIPQGKRKKIAALIYDLNYNEEGCLYVQNKNGTSKQ